MNMKLLVLAASLLVPANASFAEGGDAKAGAIVFKKCTACHAVEAKNKVGPHLMGIVDRPVASLADYKYSTAMTEFATGGKVWDEATLAAYLVAPKALVKGTKMAFAGLKKPEDIANVIAYMKDPAAAK